MLFSQDALHERNRTNRRHLTLQLRRWYPPKNSRCLLSTTTMAWRGSALKGSKFIIISVHLISNVFAEQNQFPINSHCICVPWFDLEAYGETPFGSIGTQRGRWCRGKVWLMCQKCYCVRLIYWVSFTSPNVPRYLFP